MNVTQVCCTVSLIMASEEEGSDNPAAEHQQFDHFFNPFPPQSTTLVVGPSNCGKTWFLKELLENQHLYFEEHIERVIVVNCRPGITFYPLKEAPNAPRPLCQVTEYDWEEFGLDLLQPGDVVIVDDLQEVTPLLRALITTAVHHRDLAHLFVVTHTLLKTPKYELLSYAHRIALLMRCSTVSTLGLFIVQRFFRDSELKEYLKRILGAAERQKTVLLLQLNSLASTSEPYHIALSHLEERTDKEFGFSIAYSHPYHQAAYQKRSSNTQISRLTRQGLLAAKKKMPKAADMVQGSFLVLNPECVEKIRSMEMPSEEDNVEKDDIPACLDKELWNQTVLNLEADIENFVPSKKWMRAKNLLSEILRNPDICILEDQRRMRLKSQGAVVSVLDFILTASRREGPNERHSNAPEYKVYRQFVNSLLERHAPRMLFANKLVLPHTTFKGGRPRKQQRFCSGKRCTGRFKKRRRDDDHSSSSSAQL